MDSSGKRISDIILGVLTVLIFTGTIGGLTYFEIKQRKEREDRYKANEEIRKRLREEQEKERTDYRKGVNFIGKCYTLQGKDGGSLKVVDATQYSFIARMFGSYAIVGRSISPIRVLSRSEKEKVMFRIDCPTEELVRKVKKQFDRLKMEEMKSKMDDGGGYDDRKGI